MRFLNILDAELETIQTRSLGSHNATRPAVNLPTEILNIIFQLVCITPNSKLNAKSVREARKVILSTCTRWRDVATHTPELWRHMHLDLEEGLVCPPFECLEVELARCSHAPLDLSIVISGNPNSIKTFELLEPHFGRCDFFYIKMREDQESVDFAQNSWKPKLFSGTFLRRMPRLRLFDMNVKEGAMSMEPGTPLSELSLGLGSALRVASIRYEHNERLYLGTQNQPLPHLLYLNIQGTIDCTSVVGLLRLCSSLTTLIWHSFPYGDPSEHELLTQIPSRPLILPSLKKMSVRDYVPVTCLQYMVAPKLDILVVDSQWGNDHEWMEACRTIFPNLHHLFIFARSGAQVQVLSRAEGTRRFIQSHPSLQTFASFNMNADIAQALAAKDTQSGGFVLPHLDHVMLDVTDIGDFGRDRLTHARSVLGARTSATKPIMFTFRLIGPSYPELENLLKDYSGSTRVVRLGNSNAIMADDSWNGEQYVD